MLVFSLQQVRAKEKREKTKKKLEREETRERKTERERGSQNHVLGYIVGRIRKSVCKQFTHENKASLWQQKKKRSKTECHINHSLCLHMFILKESCDVHDLSRCRLVCLNCSFAFVNLRIVVSSYHTHQHNNNEHSGYFCFTHSFRPFKPLLFLVK